MSAVVIAALFGLAFGSFANATIHRLATGRSLLGRSCCDACGRALRFVELVPVLSYLALRGRCATCGVPIGARTLLVEAGCGIAFAAAFGAVSALSAVLICLACVTAAIVGGVTLRRVGGAA